MPRSCELTVARAPHWETESSLLAICRLNFGLRTFRMHGSQILY